MTSYTPTGRPLTEYEAELLILLMEEAAEVIQATSKLLRFGKDDFHPTRINTNSQELAMEIGDFLAVYNKVHQETRLIEFMWVEKGLGRKFERMKKYMQHQPPAKDDSKYDPCGTSKTI